MEERFVAYYRVSTDKQGRDGYGLEAQQRAVAEYLNGGGWKLLREFTEVESGKTHTNRPELAKAIAYCRKHRATLVIAKLDRLARNVHFISGLMEQKVDFVAADMPSANAFMINIYAAVAQEERRMISQRTRDGLAAARARGIKLGGFNRGSAMKAHAANQLAEQLAPIFAELVGTSANEIARELNRRGVPSANGKAWHHVTVLRVQRRLAGHKPHSAPEATR
jgi:DNA invertase Pin-like site-specific DNA recombinase